MDVENVGVGANHLLKEVVAVLNGYLPRQTPSQMDGCDLYIAEEWQTKQAVVVKIGNRKQANIRGDLFYWGMLSCAHIMELTDCFFYDNYVYFVSPFYSHGSLHDILTGPDPTIKHKVITPLPMEVNELLVRKWAKQLLIFLNRLHCMGLFHLNIRKKALFVDNLTNLKVGGLGYVTLYNDRYALMGRMDHVPPEILEHYPRSVGFDLTKVDVWSVGGLICELLSGFSISGPVVGDTLADRLNRRLVIRQNLDSLMTLPALTAVSRGGRGFLAWLLKWEANARPSARQALKHPWLRDQEIRLELYQLDRLLGKMEGRAKIIPQLSLLHPMVPLVPHHGVALVRPRLLAKTEISNRQFKLGITEERLHLSKHAWSFREHVLSVDEARREMWTALYDLLGASESRWQWEPAKLCPGRQYRLPTKRHASPADSMETGEPAYAITDGTPVTLALDADDHERNFSYQLVGGFDSGRAALRGGAEKSTVKKKTLPALQVTETSDEGDIENSSSFIELDAERSTDSEESDQENTHGDRLGEPEPGFSGYIPSVTSSDSSVISRRNSYFKRKRHLITSGSGFATKRRRLTSRQGNKDGSSSSTESDDDTGDSSESVVLLSMHRCTCSTPKQLHVQSNTSATSDVMANSSSTEFTLTSSSQTSIETALPVSNSSSKPFETSKNGTSISDFMLSMRNILKPIPIRHIQTTCKLGQRHIAANASQSVGSLLPDSGPSLQSETLPQSTPSEGEKISITSSQLTVSTDYQLKELVLTPFLTPRQQTSSSSENKEPLNLLLDPLWEAEAKDAAFKSSSSSSSNSIGAGVASGCAIGDSSNGNNSKNEEKRISSTSLIAFGNDVSIGSFTKTLPGYMVKSEGTQLVNSSATNPQPCTSFMSNVIQPLAATVTARDESTDVPSDIHTFPFEVLPKSRKRAREKSLSGSSSPEIQN